MSPKQWSAFLDKFQELLPGALSARKHAAGVVGQRSMPRLGTSCQF
nr:unknown [Zea mays]